MLILSLITWLEIVLCFILFFPVQFVLFILTAPFDKRRVIMHYNSSVWCWLALALSPVWNVDFQGKENLDRKKSHIVVMNHQSLIDILITFRLFYPFKMIGKKALAYVPIVGWNLFLSGHLLVDRNKIKSQFKAIRKMEELIKKGDSMFVYPEGTRTKDGNLGEFKKGAFKTAVSTKTPVLPVVIDGPFQILPKKGFIIDRRRKITIKILPPVQINEGEKAADIAEKTRNIMNGVLEDIRKDQK